MLGVYTFDYPDADLPGLDLPSKTSSRILLICWKDLIKKKDCLTQSVIKKLSLYFGKFVEQFWKKTMCFSNKLWIINSCKLTKLPGKSTNLMVFTRISMGSFMGACLREGSVIAPFTSCGQRRLNLDCWYGWRGVVLKHGLRSFFPPP